MGASQITVLLNRINAGERHAYNDLIELVYHELRRMAVGQMRFELIGHTLQPTALVSEAWMRLADSGTDWQNSRHFFGAAAEAMRRVLVDHARRRDAAKRGGGLQRVTLTNLDVDVPGADVDLLARRSAQRTGAAQPAHGAAGGAALLRGTQHRGSRGSDGRLARHGEARLELRARLAQGTAG